IVEVALQHALLDQHLPLGRVALVVDVERAAAAGHRAVVDHRDELGGALLAQLDGEERGPLADEVGLEAVPDRLVEQDAAPARSEHNGLRTGGSGDGPEGGDRLARGLAADLGGREILVEAEVDPAPAAVEAGAPLTAFAERDAADAQ